RLPSSADGSAAPARPAETPRGPLEPPNFLTVRCAAADPRRAPKSFELGDFIPSWPSGTPFAICTALERRCRWRTPDRQETDEDTESSLTEFTSRLHER